MKRLFMAAVLLLPLLAAGTAYSKTKLTEEERLRLIVAAQIRKKLKGGQNADGAVAALANLGPAELKNLSAQLADPAATVHLFTPFPGAAGQYIIQKDSKTSKPINPTPEEKLKELMDEGTEGALRDALGDAYDSVSPAQKLAILREIDKRSAGKKETLKEKIKAAVIDKKVKEIIARAEANYPGYPEITGSDAAKLEPGATYTRKISAGGRDRHYEVHIPKNYKPGVPAPAVIDIHGGGGSPTQQSTASQMTAASEKYGFLGIFPAGTAPNSEHVFLTWNINDSETYATAAGVDDIAYFRAMFADMNKLFRVDKKRVYLTGLSQGAITSYRLACDPELSKYIAAIGPVAGVITIPLLQCKPAHPISVIHFHGTEDHYIEYKGGRGESARTDTDVYRISAADTIKFWLAADGLDTQPSRTEKKGNAELKGWGPAPSGAEVRLWTLVGGGHTWPGVPESASVASMGSVNMDINATELMLEFFYSHPYAKAGAK